MWIAEFISSGWKEWVASLLISEASRTFCDLHMICVSAKLTKWVTKQVIEIDEIHSLNEFRTAHTRCHFGILVLMNK